MTMKEMFKKVEGYNEIAEIMKTNKASIYFADISGACTYGEHFTSYSDFSKYVRHEYLKSLADKILKSDAWEIDGEIEIATDYGKTICFSAELSAN